MQILKESNEVAVIFNVINNERERGKRMVIFNDEGNKSKTIELSNDIEENIVSAKTMNTGTDQYQVFGTYNLGQTNFSDGIFYSKFENGKVDNILFWDYYHLDNFHSTLSEREQKLAKRNKEKLENESNIIRPERSMFHHDIIQVEGGFLFIGEIYHPTYSTDCDDYGMDRDFDGFKYTHAIICKFDLEGNLLWDQSIDLSQTYIVGQPKKHISTLIDDSNEIILCYAVNRKIFYKVISLDGKLVRELETLEIQAISEADKIKFSNLDLDIWYDRNFINYGHQMLHYYEGKKLKRKKVFFVSKLTYN